jgi:hypothetical protein
MPLDGAENALRSWFHRLVNAREDPATLAEARAWISKRLENTDTRLAPDFPPTYRPQSGNGKTFADLKESLNKSFDKLRTNANELIPFVVSLSNHERNQPIQNVLKNSDLLAFHAPLALLEGAWLQASAIAANSPRPETAALFAAYLALLGKDEAASPAYAYRGWLANLGVSLSPVAAWRFAHTPSIGTPALRFACIQLALGLHAAQFFPEAVGFTLAYAQSASPWRLPAFAEPRRAEILDAVAGHALAALQSDPANGDEWTRARQGYALYQVCETDYLAEMAKHAARTQSLARQVADLFRRKKHFALGYHVGIQLGQRPLEDWFADAEFDAAGFLAAFAASPYAAGASGERLFQRLAAFGGPMFGVFEREEQALIDAWLEEAEAAQTDSVSQTESVFCTSHLKECLDKSFDNIGANDNKLIPFVLSLSKHERNQPNHSFLKQTPFNPRTLFHGLINQDPQALTPARLLVEITLARAHRTIRDKGPLSRQFFEYSPETFAQRIDQIHAAEVARHTPFKPPAKLSREEYLWGIRQFAPAILVDGGWLQYQGEAINQDSRIHRLLFRIYAEELGEGNSDWNHPKIYLDLLESLAINPPATESLEFASDPSLLNSAFDLPCYLLGISQFPKTYFAETLGLNLAIELSGLGAGYLRLAAELRHWQIDPLIVTLHQSIDNLGGGHAAMACEAIELYLDEITALGGDSAKQAAWRRIWSGYRSLDAATRRFKWALGIAFCWRFLPGRLLARMPI